MISSFGSGLVLGVLSLLASGYIVYDAPICRWFWPRSTGYVLYFRTITAGLILLFLSYWLLIFAFRLFPDYSLLQPEKALLWTLPLSCFLRILGTATVYLGNKCSQEWRNKLKLEELAGNEFGQFILEKIVRRETVLITLESKKVYVGWPLEVPDNESNNWLRFAPLWSGFRDEDSTISIQIDYSKVLNEKRLQNNPMLIQVEKIVTMQPFELQVFQKFNPAPAPPDPLTQP